MLEKIRYRLIYNRKKKLNSEGKALVQIECLQLGKRMYLTTKVYLAPEQWKNGFVVNHPLADDLNAYLCRSLIDMQRTEFEFIGRGVHPTLAQLKNAVVNSISTSATFADFVASVTYAMPSCSTATADCGTLTSQTFRTRISASSTERNGSSCRRGKQVTPHASRSSRYSEAGQ